jgi:dTDP-4-dehydrorhamnose reductase
MKILVIGADGQLGQCFRPLAPMFPSTSFVFAGRKEADITRAAGLYRYLAVQRPDWVVNCAAYTAVDKAESEPALARKVNTSGVKNLAKACAELDLGLLHFSTDYVYHSQQSTPFSETDRCNPQGIYARTKLAGEKAALLLHPDRTIIIRTSWVYAEHGQNFVNTMLRLGAERAELGVVADQIGSPTYAPDLAEATLRMLHTSKEEQRDRLQGIYNYSNEGVASWYDFARAIIDVSGLSCRVKPIKTSDYPTPARRPPFSVMDKTKIKQAFKLEIPYWRDSLQRCLMKTNTPT